MTINEAIRGVNDIEFLNVKKIMKYVLDMSDGELIINKNKNITKKQYKSFLKYIERLKQGEPLQYIIHCQEFMGEKFYVDKNVLIPQPDTEIAVEETLKIISHSNKEKLDILDLCTGSGAIAISIKRAFSKKTSITASDISSKALEVAKKNASAILNDENSINFIKSDMFKNIDKKFDIIVTNPPYIETETINNLSKEVQKEPKIALDGGEDGLKFYKILKKEVKNYLKKDGFLLMEIGYNQKETITKMFENSKCIKDYGNNDRVVIWKNDSIC